MVEGKLAKVLTLVLPLAYRMCPMENAHFVLDDVCECCAGNAFRYTRGHWRALDYSPAIAGRHSSLSKSGQMTGSDLWLGGIKQALVIAIFAALLIVPGLLAVQRATKQAAESIQRHQNAQQE